MVKAIEVPKQAQPIEEERRWHDDRAWLALLVAPPVRETQAHTRTPQPTARLDLPPERDLCEAQLVEKSTPSLLHHALQIKDRISHGVRTSSHYLMHTVEGAVIGAAVPVLSWGMGAAVNLSFMGSFSLMTIGAAGAVGAVAGAANGYLRRSEI